MHRTNYKDLIRRWFFLFLSFSLNFLSSQTPNQPLTWSFAADVAEECGQLLHLHDLAAGGAEAKRLVDRRGEDEWAVIPEADGVGHRRVALGKEVLELVSLEIVRNRQIAAELRPPLTFPPLVAHLLSLYRLHQCLHRGVPLHHHHRHNRRHRQPYQNAAFNHG